MSFVILLGGLVLVFPIFHQYLESVSSGIIVTGEQLMTSGFGMFLIATSLVVTFMRTLRCNAAPVEPESGAAPDADYLLGQLSENLNTLRSQTSMGFALSIIFMVTGLIIIGTSIVNSVVLNMPISKLGIFSGVVTNFVAGSAMVLYKINFNRLNETSDRLDDAWRTLAAYRHTIELPEERKADMTVRIIEALINRQRDAITQIEETLGNTTQHMVTKSTADRDVRRLKMSTVWAPLPMQGSDSL